MIAYGHLEALDGGQEGAEEAVLETLDLPADTSARCVRGAGCAPLCDELELIFTWLRDPRFTPAEVDAPDASGDGTLFLPVEIVGSTAEPEPGPETHGPAGVSILAQRLDITLSDGRRVVVEGPTAPSAAPGLVLGLMA
ncbi:hypothetical protein [Paenirhodobacter sp.]|uniref:hypothetical protein n=1 Tax=Paenirhodobacter sp. TaxID=1965326 RepID=UPI003B41389B